MAPRQPILKIESGGTIPPPPPPPVVDESQPMTLPGPIGNVYSNQGGRRPYRPGSSIFSRAAEPGLPAPTQQSAFPGAFSAAMLQNQLSGMDTGRPPFMSAGGQREETFEEFLAPFLGGGGGGAARPDFSQYRAALTDQAQQINSQIQAMYNALGEEAGANVGRIQDIYGGAEQGIGNVYDSATANVADAFSSSQQQAADQMARLGIEAAAPAVINPAALAQAQAVSGLEQGRASGQAATQRFGASAGGFGSQMAQVAQQQGTEMNAAILASLQNRLMDSLAAEQSGGGGGGGGGGMSVRDQLALREAFESRGRVPLDEREFALREAQALAEPVQQVRSLIFDTLTNLTTRGVNGSPLGIDEAKLIAADNLRSSGYPDSVVAPLLAEY